MNTTNIEDLPTWKVAGVVWGLSGVTAGITGCFVALWLAGEHDENLLRLIDLLLGPCAVLIGTALVAITFASNWKLTREQAQRHRELVVGSALLSLFGVLAFAAAGAYTAVASGPENPALVDNGTVKSIAMMATGLLGASLGGLVTLIIRLLILVIHQTEDAKHRNEDIEDDQHIQ